MYLLFLIALVILWIEYSFTLQEPLVSEIVPVAFPGQGKIDLPPIIQPQNGPFQVQGPVRLGIAGDRYMNFSSDSNRSTISFMNNGPQGQIVSAGGSGQNDGNLLIQSQGLIVQAPTSVTGRINAPSAKFGSMKVNRADSDRYVDGWGAGIHTLDLYANGTVGAGLNGQVAAYLNRDGVIGSNNVAYLNQIKTNSILIAGRDLVGEINQLSNELRNLRVRN